MRKYMVAANWKMNGTLSLVRAFAQQQWQRNNVDVVFGLPPTLLFQASQLGLSELAAQDVSAYQSGAYTGEVSASMLQEVGCHYVIIGHSERRCYHNEDESLLVEKWKQLLVQGLTPIYCIGESLQAHDGGAAKQVLRAQLEPIIEAKLLNEQTVIAYEPVWAIGTGKAATPEYAQSAHEEIRRVIAEKHAKLATQLRILYGGSVKAENAEMLIREPDIDGFLVGGASLDMQSFTKIIEAME